MYRTIYSNLAFLAITATLGGVRGTPAPQVSPIRPAPSPGDTLGGPSTTAAAPKIFMMDEDGTRRETGGTEGCFGTDGMTQLAALPPGVMAVTYPEYGCKGQPIAVICGKGVAENLAASTCAPAPAGQVGTGSGTLVGGGVTVGAKAVGGTTEEPDVEEVDEGDAKARFDVDRVATFRTAPSAGTIACTVPGAAAAYGKAATVNAEHTDARLMELERYAGMPSVRIPEALPVKSVYLSRVGHGGVTTSPLVAPGPAVPEEKSPKPAAAPSPPAPAATIMTTPCPATATPIATPVAAKPGAAEVTVPPFPAARETLAMIPTIAATIMTPLTPSPTPAAVGTAPIPMAHTARVEPSPIAAKVAEGYAIQVTPIKLSDDDDDDDDDS